MNLKDKILKRAIEQFPDVNEEHTVSRYYPNSTEREAGALLWGIGYRNIGSCFTMSECAKAKNWHVINGAHYREIIPEN
jgi:hypothetical protein